MPVTAKLSRKFYEKLGDDIATELVDWLNAVDVTYQTQLRELNDLNWERFKTHLDAGLAALRAEMRDEFRSGQFELREELRSGLADLRIELRTEQNKLLRWMLICFSSFFVGLAGLVLGLATYVRG